MASYPSATKSFTTKTDGPSQTIFAAHANDIQDEVVAIENDLRAGQVGGTAVAVTGSTLVFGAGSAATPSVAVREADVGMYSSATNALELATNGVKAFGIDATQFIDSPTQPRCVAYHNTTQSLADATLVALLFNSEDVDTATMHDTGSNTSRVTVPTGGDGFYLIVGKWSMASSGASLTTMRAVIKKNGTTDMDYSQVTMAGPMGGFLPSVQVVTMLQLAAADYVELIAFQSSGGALNSGSATRANSNSLSVVKLW